MINFHGDVFSNQGATAPQICRGLFKTITGTSSSLAGWSLSGSIHNPQQQRG
jgi:hypothetical protein